MKTIKQIPAYEPKIIILSVGGNRYEYNSVREALKNVNLFMLRHLIGAEFGTETGLGLYRTRYIIIDEFGTIYDPRILIDLWRQYFGKPKSCSYRLPGSKRRKGGYYRKPKTTQERRWSLAHQCDSDEPAPRAIRKAANLVNSWDDIRRARRGRCWKNSRKHQWRDR